MPVTRGEASSRQLLDLGQRAATVPDMEAATAVAADIREFCRTLADGETNGGSLARTLAELNDHLVHRVVALTAEQFRLPPVAWCWLALGSEGRFEQTFVTDQDNGLIFSASDHQEAEVLRALFLPFAEKVNERLDRCGFDFCKGGVMARNPKWCLSLNEWRNQFSDWVRRPEAMALLHATIFFDFRPLYGDFSLADRLRAHLLPLTRETPAFLRMMAANALDVEAPLGFLGDVSGNAVDLKKFGVRLFVDTARILALAYGCPAVETRQRLRDAGAAAGFPAAGVAAACDAFSHLLRLRLEGQARALAEGSEPGNIVNPGELHELDQVILRESLHLARRLQQRLKLNYLL